MDVIEELRSSEQMLALRAAALHVPFAGTFELTPVCNMNCRMCYIRICTEERKKQGRLLCADEWIRIAAQAKELGLLYLLLTGGEPFLYPEFDRLYSWLGENGIVVMLNTNGTLLTEERADLLRRYPPRKVNISLYGANAKTYQDVCGYAEGFDRTVNAVRMLKERGIAVKFNSSLTPLNSPDLEAMYRLADALEVPLQATPYMFPPVRKNGTGTDDFIRFEPEEAAEMVIKNARVSFSNDERYREWVEFRLREYDTYQTHPQENRRCGFSCFASKNHFWVDWK